MSEPDLRLLIGECIHLPAKARASIWAEIDLARADQDIEWRQYLMWRAVAIACLCDWQKAPDGFWKQEAERRLGQVVKPFGLAYDVIQHRAGHATPGVDFGRREERWRYSILDRDGVLRWDDIPAGWGEPWRPKPKPHPFAGWPVQGGGAA